MPAGNVQNYQIYYGIFYCHEHRKLLQFFCICVKMRYVKIDKVYPAVCVQRIGGR